MLKKLIIYTDGGSRGNPGPAATGIVIKNEKGETIHAFGEYLGEQTNNYAEYMAFISALKKAKEFHAENLECLVDSKLVCEQLNRNWKVKEPSIQKLFIEAYNLMQQFKKVEIKHIYRDKNKEADAEVNKILDRL
jgi:ribonuclease HI